DLLCVRGALGALAPVRDRRGLVGLLFHSWRPCQGQIALEVSSLCRLSRTDRCACPSYLVSRRSREPAAVTPRRHCPGSISIMDETFAKPASNRKVKRKRLKCILAPAQLLEDLGGRNIRAKAEAFADFGAVHPQKWVRLKLGCERNR